jgi:hypothetical protein
MTTVLATDPIAAETDTVVRPSAIAWLIAVIGYLAVLLTRLVAVTSYPAVLIVWFALGDFLPRAASSQPVSPLGVSELLLLLLPAIRFWSCSPYLTNPRGRALRVLAVVGVTAGLTIIRLDAIVPAAPRSAYMLLASLVLLLPAGAEWALTRPWQTKVTTSPLTRSASMFDGFCAVTVVIALPLLFLFSAPIQLFPPPGWVDAGIYMGLSFDYEHLIEIYGWNYYALRVSYLLPSFLINLVLPPFQARVAIVAMFYLFGLVGLYTGVRVLWGGVAAAVAVASVAYNPVYLMGVTAGYVDGPVAAYLLLLFAALARWSRSGSDAWLVAAGACAMLGVLAHPLAAVPAGLFIVFFVFLRWDNVSAHPLRILGAGLFGAVATWTFFVSALSGLGFGLSAFGALKWIVTSSVGGLGAKYRHAIKDWLPVTTRLFPSLLGVAGLLVVIDPWQKRNAGRLEWTTLFLVVGTALSFPIYDLALGGSLSEMSFYGCFTLPGVAVATGAVTASLAPRARAHRLAVVLIVTLTSIAATWFAPTIWSIASRMRVVVDIQTFCLLGVAAAALLLCSRVLLPLRGCALVVFVGLQCLAGAVNADTRQIFRPTGVVNNSEFVKAAAFVQSTIAPAERAGRIPLFWYHRAAFATRDGKVDTIARPFHFDETNTSLTFFDTIAAMRFWDRSIFLSELTADTHIKREVLLQSSKTTLVILAQDPAAVDEARRILGRAGITCSLRDAQIYDSKSFVLRIALLDITGEREGDHDNCDEQESVN